MFYLGYKIKHQTLLIYFSFRRQGKRQQHSCLALSIVKVDILLYRALGKSMHFLLSITQEGLGRTVKQEQEEISRNQVRTFSGSCVLHIS